jgi:PST family polysaccharide transporter
MGDDSPRPSDHYLSADHLTRDLAANAASSAFVTILSQALRFLISVTGTVVLARLLSPEDYGLIGMVITVTGFIALFKDLGLDAATIQRPHISSSQLNTLFWINVSLGALVALLTAAIAPAVAWFYGEPRLNLITIVSAIGFFLNGIVVQHEALLRRRMRFTTLGTIELVSLIVGYAVAISLALHHAGYWALVFSQLAQASTRSLAFWLVTDWRPGLPSTFAGVGSMLAFGGNFTGFSIINYFARNLDNVLIGRYWGVQALGLYSRAYQLLLLPIEQINSPLSAVALPALSRLANSPDRYRRAYLRVLEKVAMLTMPLMALMIVTSDWIVQLTFGRGWRGVSPILSLLGIFGLIQPIGNTGGWLYITQNRTKDMLRWGLIGGSINIVSIIVGLPWGATGVAASYSLCGLIIVSPLMFWFLGRTGPVRAGDFYRTVAPSACAAISVLAVLLLFREQTSVSHVATGILVASAITACISLTVFLLLRSGREALRDVLKVVSLALASRRSSYHD